MMLGLLVFTAAAAAGAASPREPFNVAISVDRRSVSRDKPCFAVDTVVTNEGKADQEIVVWTNYAWSWISGTNDVFLDISAMQNVRDLKRLKPKQQYRSPLTLCRAPSAKKEIALRLGFVPKAEQPASGQPDAARRHHVFWSNVVPVSF
jgi:hypothetical protein